MKIKSFALICSLTFPAFLAACSLIPQQPPAARPSALPSLTVTVQVHLTQTGTAALAEPEANRPTLLPSGQTTPVATGAELLAIPAGGPLPGPECGDLVTAGLPIDVTVPDGTRLNPGSPFSKTWRLVNAGSCTWTRDYAIVWFSGQQLGVLGEQSLPEEVGPGRSIDLTVDMVAPEAPGMYQSNWKLKNSRGELFGLGPNGNSPFWVQVEVVMQSTSTPEQAASPAPTLPVFASEMASMVYSDSLDLDTGQLNQQGEDDVLYRIGAQGQPEIVPQNNARIAVFGVQAPTELDCQTATLGSTSLSLPAEDEDLYLCYRTSRALPGYMHLQKPVAEQDLISIDFVTWTVP
jgi:hypothetical protein